MPSFANAVTIARPVDEVFAFLADFENVPRWNYAIEETRKTSSGPVGVGTTYRQIRSIPTRTEEEFEVTALEPGRRLEIAGTIGPFHGTLTYVLEQADGGTTLTNTAVLEPSSAALRLAGPLVGGRVKSAVAQNPRPAEAAPGRGVSAGGRAGDPAAIQPQAMSVRR